MFKTHYCSFVFLLQFDLNLNHIKWKPNRHTNSLISGLCPVLAWVFLFGLSPNRPWILTFCSRFSTTAITWMGVHLLAIVSSYTTLLCRFISRRRILPDYRAPVFHQILRRTHYYEFELLEVRTDDLVHSREGYTPNAL